MQQAAACDPGVNGSLEACRLLESTRNLSEYVDAGTVSLERLHCSCPLNDGSSTGAVAMNAMNSNEQKMQLLQLNPDTHRAC